ncbi:hypothetical protein NJ7G_3835 [Natrinema sp. J7-2]|nr:hypothetical protein NJ7G_3835 [Natrinema sp. J7-2]
MERAVRRRLDVLIALTSSLLGVLLAYLFFSSNVSFLFFMNSVFLAVAIGVFALWYAEG